MSDVIVRELQVGDVIYSKGNYGIQSRETVDRVTAKRAFIGSVQFDRIVNRDGSLKQFNTYRWQTTWYYTATEKLDNEWARVVALRDISSIKWANYPTEKINEILKLLKP